MIDFQALLEEYGQMGIGPKNQQVIRKILEEIVDRPHYEPCFPLTPSWKDGGPDNLLMACCRRLDAPFNQQSTGQPAGGLARTNSSAITRIQYLFLTSSGQQDEMAAYDSGLRRFIAFFLILQKQPSILDIHLQRLMQECTAGGEQLHMNQMLYDTVLSVVRRLARRYPAEFYSPTGRWEDEEAYRTITHDVLWERLILRHQLEFLLLANCDLPGFQKGLERQIRWHLQDTMQKNPSYLVYKQVESILKRDQRFTSFTRQPGGRPKRDLSQWGLRVWEKTVQPYAGSALDSVAASLGIRLLPVRKFTIDPPTVFLEQQLADFLAALFHKIGATLLLQQLVEVLQNYCDLQQWEEKAVSLDEPVHQSDEEDKRTLGDVINRGLSIEKQAIIAEGARQIFTNSPNKQRRVLGLKANGCTLDEIERILGVPSSTAHTWLGKLSQQVNLWADTPEEKEAVMRALFHLCAVEELVFERLNAGERQALLLYRDGAPLNTAAVTSDPASTEEADTTLQNVRNLISFYLDTHGTREDFRVIWKALVETCAEVQGSRSSPEG